VLPRACGIPERGGVGRGVGDIQLEPVDGHQPPMAQERPPGQQSTRQGVGACEENGQGQDHPETAWSPPRDEPYGKVTKVESILEVTARGSGRWYHPYDVELATRTTTWTDSAGARTRTRVRYELLASVPQGRSQRCATGDPDTSRYFSTSEERQAFIGQSFSDLTLRDLDPPQRDTVAHPLAGLVGQRLETVEFDIPAHRLRWGRGFLNIYTRASVKDATGCTEYDAPEYPDRLRELAGLELAGVDELLDRGLVLTFTGGTELVVHLGPDPIICSCCEAATGSNGAFWKAGEPPFD
jgi:hypothetical protein